MSVSYPEGNFDGNQLRGDSTRRSPLDSDVTSDGPVSTIGDLPPDFRLASITPSKDHHLSGLSKYALDSGLPKEARPVLRLYPGLGK
jgi:hypothetical protein